jgi:hypothetical protein
VFDNGFDEFELFGRDEAAVEGPAVAGAVLSTQITAPDGTFRVSCSDLLRVVHVQVTCVSPVAFSDAVPFRLVDSSRPRSKVGSLAVLEFSSISS